MPRKAVRLDSRVISVVLVWNRLFKAGGERGTVPDLPSLVADQ